MSNIVKSNNTPMQSAFLEALFTPEIGGDLRKAMQKAGYSDNTSLKEVVEPLKDQIIDLSQSVLAMNAAKAVHGILNVMDVPQQLGAKNKLSAAESVLDRVGIAKKDDSVIKLPKGAIVFLPPKENTTISISTPPETPIIDITPKVIAQE